MSSKLFRLAFRNHLMRQRSNRDRWKAALWQQLVFVSLGYRVYVSECRLGQWRYWLVWRESPRCGYVREISQWYDFGAAMASAIRIVERLKRQHIKEHTEVD